jgi:hypothetical protein
MADTMLFAAAFEVEEDLQRTWKEESEREIQAEVERATEERRGEPGRLGGWCAWSYGFKGHFLFVFPNDFIHNIVLDLSRLRPIFQNNNSNNLERS